MRLQRSRHQPEFVQSALQEHFTIYTIARRGRGETDATVGQTVEDGQRQGGAHPAHRSAGVFTR
jgi:hypothetical protein